MDSSGSDASEFHEELRLTQQVVEAVARRQLVRPEIPLETPGAMDFSNTSNESFTLFGTFDASSSAEDAQREEDDDFHLTQRVAEAVARMQLVRPEVLRTTPVHQALGALTLSGNDKHWYHKSRPSSRIGTFWSHSWHGGRWKKILTLLVFYNGRTAIYCGFIVSFIMTFLFALGFLPGFRKNQYLERTSVWGLGSGSLAALITLIFWRPRQRVFLDRICINQHDSKLKSDAICSLAGMLNKSDKMLVLWDPTWSERLWCLFELTAFLKSKSESAQKLMIWPIFLGPCSIVSFAAVHVTFLSMVLLQNDAEDYVPTGILMQVTGSLAGYFMIRVFRGYFRSLEELKQQLCSVDFDRTRSQCCEEAHQNGQLCDRKIVKACVAKWFGSQRAFEECIRSEVMGTIVSNLEFDQVVRRSGILSVTSPALWAWLDVSASWVAIGERSRAVQLCLDGFTNWLLMIPFIAELVVFLSRRFHQKASSPLREVLMNLGVLMMVVPLRVLLAGVYYMFNRLEIGRELSSILFAAVMLLVNLLHHRWKRPSSPGARDGSPEPGLAHTVASPSAQRLGAEIEKTPRSQE
ncbi:unnamed protein product [Durusdinium trenchii]|uniref:Transmembrane protein n=1 Tax=Durusdinium trenchii TaxID=1381693 RepID=A0ABP0QXB4_9DINO